ncbi:MAG: 30S ribosomal protein S7 [Candidatus Eisenbacteria bacterium]|nr:30S ribosomal protein S7 [Candidatus Eisenbacteria bacterium]
MPRKRVAAKKEIGEDPQFKSVLISKLISVIMRRGKKSIAKRIVSDSLKIVQEKTGQDGLSVFKQALNNVKPIVEVKSRRVGGATYQVPVEVRADRRIALGLRWLVGFSKSRPDHTMQERLAAEIIAASKNEGPAVKKREDTHKMAEANKAFAHYRW